MFIALEGLDGAGKSTQLKLLCRFLAGRGKQTKYLHFPRFDAPVFGEMIAKFLRGDLGDVHTVNPYIVALLFAGDRHAAAATLRQWMAEGYVVVVDRYVYSNIGYQCAKLHAAAEKRALREWILHLEYDYFNIPKPDLTLFLDVPLTHVEQKLEAQRDGDDRAYLQGKKDIHEASLSLQEQVRAVYLEQPALDATFHVVDCGRDGKICPANTIFERITDSINTLIINH
jgi:dTMP kinase